jgi:uroporphyrinogen-III synthase
MTMMNDRPEIFISRSLVQTSVLLNQFPVERFLWTAQSMVEFSSHPFELPESDWLFFYSKTGVTFFHQQCKSLSKYKIACFGPGTAKAIETLYQCKCDFIGTGEKNSTAEGLLSLLKNESICFVRGELSAMSVQRIIALQIEWSEIIVYHNQITEQAKLKHYDVAIMTSPLNYQGFIKNGGTAQHIISIGPTTFKKIHEINAEQHIASQMSVAQNPSEESIAEVLGDIYTVK